MAPLTITDYTLTTCLGAGRAANWEKIRRGESGLQPCDFAGITDLPTWVGAVAGVDDTVLPPALRLFDCRNNRLAWLALQQDGFAERARTAVARYGAARVGVFVGTSTSGIHQTELAYGASSEDLPEWYRYRHTHNIFSVADFVQQCLGTRGMCVAVSTACSSSAKVFASAYRAIAGGLCDAAVVGGVDSLCLTTLYGFNSLQLVSHEKCRPFDRHRSGISIGEAGGFALLEKAAPGDLHLLGYGESGDAHHMSAPHPEGEGARSAMAAALARAGVAPDSVDYINLHGTGTQANDAAEAIAVAKVFGDRVSASSTKGWTGHTLGAAGIVEAAFALLSVSEGYAPPNLHLEQPDASMRIALLRTGQHKKVTRALSNSFGFGGSNCSLLLGVRP